MSYTLTNEELNNLDDKITAMQIGSLQTDENVSGVTLEELLGICIKWSNTLAEKHNVVHFNHSTANMENAIKFLKKIK